MVAPSTFDRRLVAAASFGMVLNPVNASMIAVAVPPIAAEFDTLVVGGLLLPVAGLAHPLVLLFAVGGVFGVGIGLTGVGNQAALYTEADRESIGAASGLYRTCMYLGGAASAIPLNHAFTAADPDGALGRLSVVIVVVGGFLFTGTVLLRLPHHGTGD